MATCGNSKRGKTSPTRFTPRQANKKASRIGTESKCTARSLKFDPATWTSKEEYCLVRYVINKGFTTSWPITKKHQFWDEAALFLLNDGYTQKTNE